MKYSWNILETSKDVIKKTSFNPVLMKVLLLRGIDTVEKLKDFTDRSLKSLYDPEKMKDMSKAAERLAKAVKNKEKVLIYGDYDVDGVTSIAVMVHFFRFNGQEPDFYVPHRIRDGYGLNNDTIKKFAQEGISLIVTVDTGINNCDEVEFAREQGIDVIVTDHHKPPEVLPKAYAVVNPNRIDCEYPNKKLAGVGVAFKLVHASLRKLEFSSEECRGFLTRLIDYVTLGTIADLASLEGENRKLVSFGLKTIKKSTFPGIKILVDQAVVGNAPVNASTVAYRITPKLNASGRVDHGKVSAKLLIEDDIIKCRKYFSKVDILNRERQMIEEKDLKKALEIIDSDESIEKKKIIVLFDKSFRAGVNGIIAARIVERYSVPAIVFAADGNGNLKGSARTVKNFNIFNCIDTAKDILESFGGHAFAAGLTIQENKLSEFRERMELFAADYRKQKVFEPVLNIESEIAFKDIDDDFVSCFKEMAPFGLGNPEPVFLVRNVRLKSEPQIMRGKHVKFTVGEGTINFEVIGFNMAKNVSGVLAKNDKTDIVFKLGINYWLGQEKLQLEMIDFAKAEGGG